MTTTFQKATARGFEHSLASPLPSSLAGLVADRSDQHRKVAAKLDTLRARRVELSRELAASEQADREDAVAAAAAGRDPKRRQKTARTRGLLADVERDVQAFTDAAVRSADALLAAAEPQAVAAIAKAAEERERAIDRARELLAALDGALAEAGDLAAERVWLRRLAGGARNIEPFRGAAADPSLGRLRRVIADAFLAWEAEEASRQADLDREKAYEDEHAPEWARRREQAEREDAAARVRFEGMRLTPSRRPAGRAGPSRLPRRRGEPVTRFSDLHPAERVQQVELVLTDHLTPGAPAFTRPTRIAMGIVKRALVDDTVSDEEFEDVLAAWHAHTATLSEYHADAAGYELRQFAHILDGMRDPPTEEDEPPA